MPSNIMMLSNIVTQCVLSLHSESHEGLNWVDNIFPVYVILNDTRTDWKGFQSVLGTISAWK